MNEQQIHTINRRGDLEILRALKTAEQVVEKLPLAPERLIQLAEAGLAPHIRIDGGPPLFQLQEIRWWIAQNLAIRHHGYDIPRKEITFHIASIDERGYVPTELPPKEISTLPGLLQLPIERVNPGVYFLCLHGKVVYVGQSTAIARRVADHANEGLKEFDAVFFVNVPAFALDDVEGAFIRNLRPPYNGTPPTRKNTDSDDAALERFVYNLSKEKE